MAQDADDRFVCWFIRHAESVWNRDGLVQGQATNAPGLTRDGAAQARRLADDLAGCGASFVVTSDLARAIETATPIAERLGVPIGTDRRLRERSFGVLEGGPTTALLPEILGYRGAEVVDPDARAVGGESLRELDERVSEWLGEVRTRPPAPVFVAVTHGGLLRVAGARLAGSGLRTLAAPAPNAAVWRVQLAPWTLIEQAEAPFA